MTNFVEQVKLPAGRRRRTPDGYLVAQAPVARAGVQLYNGAELGVADRETIAVYRPPSEVFHADSVRSYAHRPVTVEHPKGGVSADNWRSVAVGHTGGDVIVDGGLIQVQLVLMDAGAIAEVEGGRRELSMGYTAQLVLEDGVTPEGERYDAVLRDLRMNHLAVVAAARGGAQLRIGDAKPWGAAPVNREDQAMSMKTVVLGDAAVQVAVADAAAVEAFKTAMQQRVADAEAKTAKTEEELEAERKKRIAAEDARPTPEKIAKLVADRVALEAQAKILDSGLVCDGLTDDEVRARAVTKVFGDSVVDGATPAEIAGMFRAASQTRPHDGVRRALGDSAPKVGDAASWERAAAKSGVKMKKGA